MAKREEELPKNKRDTGAITNFLCALSLVVVYVVQRGYSWHYPSCPFCKNRLTRPEISCSKYLKPFICPNCKLEIPEDYAGLKRKYYDHCFKDHLKRHSHNEQLQEIEREKMARISARKLVEMDKIKLHFLTLDGLEEVIRYERDLVEFLDKVIKNIRSSERKGRNFNYLYTVIKKDLLDSMRERLKHKDISDKELKKDYRLEFWPFFKKYFIYYIPKENSISQLLLSKKHFVTRGVVQDKIDALTLDDITKAMRDVDKYLTKLEAEEGW